MKTLRKQRILLNGQIGGDPQVYEAHCWRYTLTVYRGSDKGVLIDGAPLCDMLNQASFVNAGVATYVERVGGASGKENDVKFRLEITKDPAAVVGLLGVLTIESWSDEE